MPIIAVVNRSSVMTDAQLAPIVAALQTQVSRDFSPLWGCGAHLLSLGAKDRVPHDAWKIIVLDDSDQADALGYHDVTRGGRPLGKAFVRSDIRSGNQPSVTISHELLEMLADPEINLAAVVGGKLWAYEVCDPCEADNFGYKIDDVLVSDFVTPLWFAPVVHPSGRFDFCGHIKRPLQLLRGGYAQYLEIGGGMGWQQFTLDKVTCSARPHRGSRRERRRTSREHWQESCETEA